MWNTPLHPAFTVAGPGGVSMKPLVGVQPPTGYTLPQQQQPPLKMTPAGGGPPPGAGNQALMAYTYQPPPRIQTMAASSRMGPAGGGATRGSRCHFCNEMISGDQFIRTDMMVCHNDCFRCSICCTGMNGMRAFRLGSRICCQQCFRTMTVCAYCGGPIMNGKSWVEFNNQAYHPNHLFCTAPGCGVALRFESGYALSDQRLPVCAAHHPNAVACAVCGCLVVGEGIQLSDCAQMTLRHPECFMCSLCGFLLSWDYVIDQYGRPLCSDHIDMMRSFQQQEPKSKPKVNFQDPAKEPSSDEKEKVEPVPDSWVDRRSSRASSLYSKVDTRTGEVVAKRRFSKVDRSSGKVFLRPSAARFSKVDTRTSWVGKRGSQVAGPDSKQARQSRNSLGPDSKQPPTKGILKPSRLYNASNLSSSEDDSHASFHLSASRSNCEADDAWESEALSEEEVTPEYDDCSSDWQEGQEASSQPLVARTSRDQSLPAIPASSSSSSRSSSWATTGSSAAAAAAAAASSVSSRSLSCQRTLNAASVESLELSRPGGSGGGTLAALPAPPVAAAGPHIELSPSAASLLAKSD